MSKLSKTEQRIIQLYNSSQRPDENARRISRKTGISLYTCRSYITALKKGLTFYEYITQNKGVRFVPTEPEEVAELYERQNKSSERALTEIERNEMTAIIQRMIDDLLPKERDFVISHFYKGKSCRQIAREKGLSKNAVHVKMNKILDKLRFQAERKGLEDYVAA